MSDWVGTTAVAVAAASASLRSADCAIHKRSRSACERLMFRMVPLSDSMFLVKLLTLAVTVVTMMR